MSWNTGKASLFLIKSFTSTDMHSWYWKLLCIVLEGTLLPEEKGNHQYHPARNPKTDSNDMSAKILQVITQF